MQDLLNPNLSTKPYMKLYAKSITLDSSGGTPSPLNYYEEFNFTTTMTGPWTTSPSVTIRLTRIGRTVICTSLAQVTGTFSAPSLARIDTLIPARFRLFGETVRFFAHVVDNNLGVQSHGDVNSSGQLEIGVLGGNFTAGNCVVLVFSAVWTI